MVDVDPDIFLFTYSDYRELDRNTENPEEYPYLFKPREIGDSILLLTFPDKDGHYIKLKSTIVFRLKIKN